MKKIFNLTLLLGASFFIGMITTNADGFPAEKINLDFTCVNNDNVAETTAFDDYDGDYGTRSGEFVTEFMLPNYCSTGTGCTLVFDTADLAAMGKYNFGSGEEYFFLRTGTGVTIHEEFGPNPSPTYATDYNKIVISPDFDNSGKMTITMGANVQERWLTFFSEAHLGVSYGSKVVFPEMFLTQPINFTTKDTITLQSFYGMKNLIAGIEPGKIISNISLLSNDGTTVEKEGEPTTISSTLDLYSEYKFNFINLYKPYNELILEITYLNEQHSIEDILALAASPSLTPLATTKVTKNLKIVRSAFNSEFISFGDTLNLEYLARPEFYYCPEIGVGATSCTKSDFNPYLQLVYYKDNVVVGTEQVRIHDFEISDQFDGPLDGKLMDEVTTLPVDNDPFDGLSDGIIIPIEVDVANNANTAVRNADKVKYYLTNGALSKDSFPSLNFGIGSGLEIEREA